MHTVGTSARAWLTHRGVDLRPDSLATYRTHLASVIRCCGPDWPTADWGRGRCDEWWSAQGHLAPRSLHHRRSIVHLWCEWCVLHEAMPADPTVWLPRVKMPRCVPRALTVAQVEAVWAACHSDRDRRMISLMLFEGLRRGEVAGLDWADVDLGRRCMLVRGKGGHERVVPVSEMTGTLLGRDGRRWGPVIRSHLDGAPLTSRYVTEIVRKIMRRAGVAGSPHALRHTAASDALDAGCPIRTVQRFLGHSTVTTTEIYLRRDVGDLAGAVDGRPYMLG